MTKKKNEFPIEGKKINGARIPPMVSCLKKKYIYIYINIKCKAINGF